MVASGAVVGALVLANFGAARDLRIDGVPVGRELGAPGTPPAGSCIVVLATDAALDSAGLERLARRAGLGLARCGSVAHHGSGEIFLAFSTATEPAAPFDDLFSAAVDATEEAVVNALWAATTTTGRDGGVVEALPHEPVLEMLERAGRLGDARVATAGSDDARVATARAAQVTRSTSSAKPSVSPPPGSARRSRIVRA